MSAENLFGLALFSFVSSITPGPNNLMLLASGVNFGIRKTVPHMLGIQVGFNALVLVVGLGLGAAIAAMPSLHWALKIACALYLLFLAWRIASQGSLSPTAERARPMRFGEAVAFQAVNPKGWAMALAVAAGYGGGWTATLTNVAVMLVINSPCMLGWALFGVGLREVLSNKNRLRIFNLTMAGLLVLSILPFLK
jgi:threonine/homoserine/homoserine lactone efflux protein